MLIKEAHKEYLESILDENIDLSNDEEVKDFFNTLTKDKAEKLGFRRWSEDTPIYLIPGCFMDILPDGLVLTSIMGEKKIVGKDYIDADTRGGLLAYGITIK